MLIQNYSRIMREDDNNAVNNAQNALTGRLHVSENEDFQTMSKEELVEKYMALKSDYQKAKRNAEFYRSVMVDTLNKYNQLKLKLPGISGAEYNKGWSWVNKIVFVLKKEDRPLLSSEIIDIVRPHEPGLEHSNSPAQSFSAHLTKAVKYGRVIAYKLNGSRGFYYALPKWLDEEGQLTDEYEDKIFFK